VKILYLVRHAKSSWKYPNLDDFERPLNKRGRKSAPLMGSILKKLDAKPDLLISSPAARASMTARIISEQMNYPLEKIRYDESVYASNENELLHIIAEIDDRVTKAMLIGHNPGLTSLANLIGDSPISNIPTSGVCCIELSISSWKEIWKHRGKVKFFEYPKKYTP
jgi:phosphohistidine phosphatase